VVAPVGVKTRNPGGILGCLCKRHYPGLVPYAGGEKVAKSFADYALKSDRRDEFRRRFAHKQERVLQEFWVSLRHSTYFTCLVSHFY
jgi:hypothetical protein